ncbi:hypothetical protein WN55_06993 [Dufourea novaeangliae]|uniref:Uncharacterized protein n=1 Tax=Dufourea novaeangliae TaxID=178035 RepID=A0A154P2Z8_DUFNO|nr:hypothetical protein WN55_06993 [Dufourea novaeangliae]
MKAEMVRCCVPDCGSAKSRVKTYVLPKEKEESLYASHHNKTNLKYDSILTLSLHSFPFNGTYLLDEMMQPEDGTSMTVESQFEELWSVFRKMMPGRLACLGAWPGGEPT